MGFAGPVLVEQEHRWVIHRLVQVVIEAPGILAARGNQRQQFLPHLAFLPRLGFDLRSYSKRFVVHGGRSSRRRTQADNEEFCNTVRLRDRVRTGRRKRLKSETRRPKAERMPKS